MKVNDMTGAALDWAVAKCEGINNGWGMWSGSQWIGIPYSTDWAQGGLIIEREKIGVGYDQELGWVGIDTNAHYQTGDTPLVAAMRCYVASKLGDDIEIPKELK